MTQRREPYRRRRARQWLKHAEQYLVTGARERDKASIELLLLCAANGLAEGINLPPGVAKFISDGLRKVYDERIGEKAFGIERRRGEKDTRKARRRGRVVAAYVEGKQRVDGVTQEAAISDAASLFNWSESTIRNDWREHREDVRRDVTSGRDLYRDIGLYWYGPLAWPKLAGNKIPI